MDYCKRICSLQTFRRLFPTNDECVERCEEIAEMINTKTRLRSETSKRIAVEVVLYLKTSGKMLRAVQISRLIGELDDGRVRAVLNKLARTGIVTIVLVPEQAFYKHAPVVMRRYYAVLT